MTPIQQSTLKATQEAAGDYCRWDWRRYLPKVVQITKAYLLRNLEMF